MEEQQARASEGGGFHREVVLPVPVQWLPTGQLQCVEDVTLYCRYCNRRHERLDIWEARDAGVTQDTKKSYVAKLQSRQCACSAPKERRLLNSAGQLDSAAASCYVCLVFVALSMTSWFYTIRRVGAYN